MIRKSIPSDTATFIARDNVELPQDLEDPAMAEQLMLGLDGTRNVSEAANLFPHARLQAYECMARFVRDRLVRAAAAEDLVVIAGSLEQDDPEHARRIISRGLEVEPHHLNLLALEARLAVRLDLPKAAAAALKLTAHVLLEAGDTARSRAALDEARTLDPADAAIRERILALDLEEGRFAQAVQDGMQLVALYRAPGLHAKAREVLERLVEADPVALQLRLELARSQVDGGDPEAAVDGLVRHGKKLVSREEYVDARKVYEEVLTIGPTHKAARLALEMIDKQIFAQRRERRRRMKRVAIAALAGIAFGALLTLEVAARIDLVRTTRLIAREELIEQRRYADAIHSFEELASRHPLTATVLFDVRNRIADLAAKLPPPSDGSRKK
jgi:tetratricopeptide (TPR) repeat protein